MKPTTEWQKKFRAAVKEFIQEQKDWYSDYINYRVSFKDDEQFHLDVIEDYCSHIHVHGTYEGDGRFYISHFSSAATIDLTQAVTDFIQNLNLDEDD